MENRKNVFCKILLSLIFVLVGNWLLFRRNDSECDLEGMVNIDYDVLFEKQWYLHSEVNGMKCIEKYIDEGGFTHSEICFESTIDLGVVNFWKQNVVKNDKELVIALLDTCVDIEHEDLQNHIWINEKEIPNNLIDDDKNGYIDDYYGWNFCEDNSNVNSQGMESAHGTHCAGIIAAEHNGIGIMGILGNTNVKIMILPIYGQDELKVDDIVDAINYADIMGADVCSISGVVMEDEQSIENAIEKSKMYFVVAAGNFQSQFINGLDLNDYKRYPACCVNEKVITVASVNGSRQLSDFSNYGLPYVDIAAPGENIFSTLPDNKYGYASGTSMAVPVVCSILGAYYYGYADTIEDAVDIMMMNANRSVEIEGQVMQGRIVQYKLQDE